MDRYTVYMSARHARYARKKGGGDRNEGIRLLIEEDEERVRGFSERRTGARDRREK